MKKLTVLLLAFCLLLCTGVYAEEDNFLAVNGLAVTRDNAGDVLGDGTVQYDFATNTLTLSGAVLTHGITGITQETGYSEVIAINSDSPDGLNLVLADGTESRILIDNTGNGNYSALFGVACSAGMLNVSGGGSLEISLSNSSDGYSCVYGLSAKGIENASVIDISVSAVSQLDNADAEAVCCYGDVKNTGKLHLSASSKNGEEGYGYAFGVNVYGDLNSTGTLNAETRADNVSYALCITGEAAVDAVHACNGSFEGNFFVREGADVPADSVYFDNDHRFTTYVSNGDGTKTAVCDYEGCEETDTVAEEIVTSTQAPAAPGTEGKARQASLTWLWILLGVLVLCACGYFVFRFLQQRKRQNPSRVLPEKYPDASDSESKGE